MLVEDDNNLREIYGERLIAEGYEIVSAGDGEEALALAVKEKPDLIISDVMMPKISGFDMLDILRQTPETKDTKVIMMTALSQTEDKDRADKLGADKYLVKSQVTLEDVARVVHDLIYGPEESPAEAANETQANSSADTPLFAAASFPTDDAQAAPEIFTQAAAPTPPIQPVENAGNPVLSMMPETVPTTPNSLPVAADNEGEPIVVQPFAAPVAAPAEPVNQTVAAPQLAPSEPAVVPIVDPVTPAYPVDPQPVSDPNHITTPVTNPNPFIGPAEQPVATLVNPIVGQPVVDQTANGSQSAPVGAQTAEEETADIAKQIEDFVNSGLTATTKTTEAPLVEPTEQELIHAQNAVEDPNILQPAVTAGIANPQQPQNPTVPPIVASDSNPEPASARKKVIAPINNPNDTPNIYELYEKEMAVEAANTPVVNPGAGATLASVPDTNPITTNTNPAPAAPLETVDASQIQGVTVGEEAPLPPPPADTNPAPAAQQINQAAQAPDPQDTGGEVPDPNDPASLAL